jgi:hypothetical protein
MNVAEINYKYQFYIVNVVEVSQTENTVYKNTYSNLM